MFEVDHWLGSGPRFSIPFFQGVSYDATFESMDVPEEVKALKKRLVNKDEVEMTFKKEHFERLGEATLMNRIKVNYHPFMDLRNSTFDWVFEYDLGD